MVVDAVDGLVADVLSECVSGSLHPEMWEIEKLRERIFDMFGVRFDDLSDEDFRDMAAEEVRLLLTERATEVYAVQEEELGEEATRQIERMLLLQHTDQFWKDHLLAMDRLREGIGLRGYGQRNPLLEYKKEGTNMYMLMTSLRDEAVVSQLLRMELAEEEEVPEISKSAAKNLVNTGSVSSPQPAPAPVAPEPEAPQVKRPAMGEESLALGLELGLGRNDPCPCGSGKKFKKCCGTAAAIRAFQAKL